MRIKEVLQQIRDPKFLLAFFDLIFLIFPGILVLFVYERQTFLSLDWIKLTLLSAAITAPISFLNMLLLAEVQESDFREKDELFSMLTVSEFITTICFSAILVIMYLSNQTLRRFALMIVAAEFLLAIYATLKGKIRERRKKKLNE